MAVIGYARVSTEGQHLDAQIAALEAAGADSIFKEKISGAASNRKQLDKALAALNPGDTLLVTRLDRLARSTRDLLNLLAALSAKGAAFKSLNEAWADTTTPAGRLMLTVLGGLAEFERELILARTSEGRERARERGVHLGRKSRLSLHQRRELFRMAAEGVPQVEIARLFGMHPSTICGLLKQAEARELLAAEEAASSARIAAE